MSGTYFAIYVKQELAWRDDRRQDVERRRATAQQHFIYYPLLYTTLFMWGVEVLGWEVFMMAAAIDPDRFHQHFLIPCAAKSNTIVTEIARASSSPIIFVH